MREAFSIARVDVLRVAEGYCVTFMEVTVVLRATLLYVVGDIVDISKAENYVRHVCESKGTMTNTKGDNIERR